MPLLNMASRKWTATTTLTKFVKFKVFQTIGKLKNIGGKEGKDSEKEKEAGEEEMCMKEAMRNSKTRFIII